MKQGRQIFFLLVLIVTLDIALLSHWALLIRGIALLIYLCIVLSVSFILMLENRSPYKTLLWIYVLIFIPIFGYVFYFFSGQLEVKGYLFYRKREQDEQFIKSRIQDYHPMDWGTLSATEQSIATFIQRESDFPVSFGTTTKILKNGQEKFPQIKESLLKAKTYIHMEYYTFRTDQIGTEIIDILINKAMEGVEVRFLFDAVGSFKISNKALQAMEAAGIVVACFSPIKYGFFNQKLNFRNHRKIVIIDGKTGFVGGLNVGDEYLGKVKRFGFWRDTHVMVEGDALADLHSVFLLDWAYVVNEPQPQEYLYPAKRTENSGGVQVVASGPGLNQGLMGDLYFYMIISAKKSIWIATPYFIPSKAIRTALSIAGRKGIDVRLMVPEISDGFLTQYGTRSYFGELLEAGVDIYMYQKGFMHQKIMIIDGELASIGTANMDLRSLNLNFEVNVFLYQSQSVQDLVHYYLDDISESVEVQRERALLARIKESFARLFSPVL